MKKSGIILIVLSTSALLSGCVSARQPAIDLTLVRSELSWATFCASRGFHIDCCTAEAVCEYLGTWCGSPEEEQALTKAGIR